MQALIDHLLARQAGRRHVVIDDRGRLRPLLRAASDGSDLSIEGRPPDAPEHQYGALFGAVTGEYPVFAPFEVTRDLIDPVLWPRYSALRTSDPQVSTRREPFGWTGTIVEDLVWSTIEYRNCLDIDFGENAPGESTVRFTLAHCYKGGLDHEVGYLKLRRSRCGRYTLMSSYKQLRYEKGALFYTWPPEVLARILCVWLSAAVAEYAEKLTSSLRAEGRAGPPGVVATLRGVAHLAETLFCGCPAAPRRS